MSSATALIGGPLARAALLLSLVLLVANAMIVGAAVAVDLATRDSSPEVVVRGYFGALERGDLHAALAAIDPSARQSSSAFVANLLNNEYRIEGIAVRQTSILGSLRGEPPGPREVTIFLAITQAVDGVRWEAGPRVPLVQDGGRWYLARPPLAG
jgi:hypothetical protein